MLVGVKALWSAEAAEALVETKAVDVLIICGATTSAEGRDRAVASMWVDEQLKMCHYIYIKRCDSCLC